MSDKSTVDSVVEHALALKEIAIRNAKEDLMNELAPKIEKLFEKKINKSSRALTEQDEDDEEDVTVSVSSDEDEEKDEAEVDLDDLAKELEDEEGEKSVEEKVKDLEQKVDSVEVKVDAVEDKVEELSSESSESEELEIEDDEETKDEEELEIEDDEEESKSEELGEAVNIDVTNDDVNVNVLGSQEDEYIDIIDDSESYDEGEDEDEEDVETSPDDIEEALMRRESKKMKSKRIREQSFSDPVDPDEGVDEVIDIVDDENWDEAEAPKKVDWSKHVPKLESNNRVLRRALRRASMIIANERRSMKKVNDVLKETRLLNEKLVLVNRIFAKYDLPKDKKYKVLEAFDKASTVRDSMVVYETILEHLGSKKDVSKKVSRLQESVKKAVKIVSEEKKVEEKDLLAEVCRPTGMLPQDRIVDVDRLMKLAGISE